ncbi:MAG: hypothetical protein FT714_18555, partial [Pantoea sp. Pent]|nr:hypothetical protein [Pantoea sp. Pent]
WYSTTVGVIDLKKKSITMGKGCEKVFTMSPNTCLPCPRTVQWERAGVRAAKNRTHPQPHAYYYSA